MQAFLLFLWPAILLGVCTGSFYAYFGENRKSRVISMASRTTLICNLFLQVLSDFWTKMWPPIFLGFIYLFCSIIIAGIVAFLVWRIVRISNPFLEKFYVTFKAPDTPKADEEKYPGFDGIRLIAACGVLFTHSFLISDGPIEKEPLDYLKGNNGLGTYGVFTFFIISGFLLTRSLNMQKGLLQFVVNRFLRIFPGFAFCAFVSVYLVGALTTYDPLLSYIMRPDLIDYIWNTMQCFCDYTTLEDVYNTSSKENTLVINGSLWSLRYELISYAFLLLLWTLLREPRQLALVMGILAGLSYILPKQIPYLIQVDYTLPFFAGGIIMYHVNKKYSTNTFACFLGLGMIVLSAFFGFQHQAFALFGSYIIIHLGKNINFLSVLIRRTGDLSYGVYLFGWPAQQLLKQYTDLNQPYLFFILSLPIVFAFAYISWRLVEKPALSLKNRVPWFRQGIGKILSR